VKTIESLWVCTDLDGSLLDHSYRWEEARPALERLQKLQIPVILNSSKTFAELQTIAEELQLGTPLICENGGVVAIPENSIFAEGFNSTNDSGFKLVYPGENREFLLKIAHQLRQEQNYRFNGFHDWTEEEVSLHTSLSRANAAKAKCRHATEPILWQDNEKRKQEFKKALEKHNLQLIEGGRFSHIMGQTNKREGMRYVLNLYCKFFPHTQWTVLALGDSANDLEMLSAADIAGVIPSPSGNTLKPQAPRIIKTDSPGPQGWNDIVKQILNERMQ
jgi:mannosyl-3-phosphoglycerate phosphatase